MPPFLSAALDKPTRLMGGERVRRIEGLEEKFDVFEVIK